MLLQAFSIALALFPISVPNEIIWVNTFEEVRPVLDEYWADNGILAVGLSVKAGDTCIIYAIDGGRKRDEEIYLHEAAHCWGLDHKQISEIGRRMNMDI